MQTYINNLTRAISRTINALFHGEDLETICSRAWRKRTWYLPLLNALFFWWVPKDGRPHCQWCYDSEREVNPNLDNLLRG